jgi:6-pyruvoyltetrahydropterin/6-carboxytetrahydropterin synthase
VTSASPAASYEIVKRVSFEAAHYLPAHADAQRDETAGYRRLHGHSFQVEAALSGPLDPSRAWVSDFSELTRALTALAARLDHHLLNEIEGLETPTLEHIAAWFMRELARDFPSLSRVTVARPSLGESCTVFAPAK